MIGIVGGMGPWATSDLLDKLAQETVSTRDQEHVSLIVLSEPAEIPDRTAFVVGRGGRTNPGDIVAGLVARLIDYGATVVGIPCNTLHLPLIFEPIVDAARSIRLVSIVDETIRHITERYPEGSVIGVIGTSATIRFRLYTDALERAGYRAVTLDDRRNDEIDEAVIFGESGVKQTHGAVSARALETVRRAASDLAARGAHAVVFGCTELPAVLRPGIAVSWPAVELVDPTRLLARGLIRSYDPDKLRPGTFYTGQLHPAT
jgi:aspartate racemase